MTHSAHQPNSTNQLAEFLFFLAIGGVLWVTPMPTLSHRTTFVIKLLTPATLCAWVWWRADTHLDELKRRQIRDAKLAQELGEAAALQEEATRKLAEAEAQSAAQLAEVEAQGKALEQQILANLQQQQQAARNEIEQERKAAEENLQQQFLTLQAQYQQFLQEKAELEHYKAELARQPSPEELDRQRIQEHARAMRLGKIIGAQEEDANTDLELKRIENEARIARKRQELGLTEDGTVAPSALPAQATQQMTQVFSELISVIRQQGQIPASTRPSMDIDVQARSVDHQPVQSAAQKTMQTVTATLPSFTPDPEIKFDRHTQESDNDFPEFEIT